MLELRKLLILSFEIADELLRAIRLEAVRANAALRLPLRTILPDQIQNPVFQLLRGRQGSALHQTVTQGAIHFRHCGGLLRPWRGRRPPRQLPVQILNEESPAIGLLLE